MLRYQKVVLINPSLNNGLHKFFFFFILCFSFCYSSFSQNFPWNAKFIISYQNGYNDTVWVGCDTAATDFGYDAGLDVLDTTFSKPLGILSYDSVVQQTFGIQHCGNLKKDIKAFKTGIVKFTFFLDVDSLFSTTQSDPAGLISWDTLDFKTGNDVFNNDSFRITSLWLESYNGYLHGIDGYFFNIYNEYDTINAKPPFYFYGSSVNFYPEQPLWGCNSNDLIMVVELYVAFNLYYTVGTDEIFQSRNQICYPNPGNGRFRIDFEEKFTGNILAYNILGEPVLNESVKNIQHKWIDLTVQPKGIYFLHLFNETQNNIHKLIIR